MLPRQKTSEDVAGLTVKPRESLNIDMPQTVTVPVCDQQSRREEFDTITPFEIACVGEAETRLTFVITPSFLPLRREPGICLRDLNCFRDCCVTLSECAEKPKNAVNSCVDNKNAKSDK